MRIEKTLIRVVRHSKKKTPRRSKTANVLIRRTIARFDDAFSM